MKANVNVFASLAALSLISSSQVYRKRVWKWLPRFVIQRRYIVCMLMRVLCTSA